MTETIKRNYDFRKELEKHLSENKQVNLVNDEPYRIPEYEILKCKIKVNSNEIECVIDTGASTSIISKRLATNLNLHINKTRKTDLTMAGNQIVQSLGECANIPIEIGGNVYLGNACIMTNSAHDLLL